MKRDQVEMFTSLEGLVTPAHPYRRFEVIVDFSVLARPLQTLYSDRGRPELGAERAFRMLVLQFLEDVSDREMERLKLITGIRRNMKNYLMPLLDKLLLRKWFVIETLFDKLKSDMGLEHSRHRSPTNAFVHILSCLAAYSLGKTKIQMTAVSYP